MGGGRVDLLLLEALLEQDAGALKAFADRGRRNGELLGDLFAAAALVVVRSDGRSEGLGQFFEAALKGVEDGILAQGSGGLPARHRRINAGEIVLAEVVAAVPAQPFAPLVADDASHPGAEVAGHVEDLAFLISDDESLLHDVAGGGAVAGEGQRVDEQVAVMGAHEIGKIPGLWIGPGLSLGFWATVDQAHRLWILRGTTRIVTFFRGDGEREALLAPIAKRSERWQQCGVSKRSLKWIVPVLGPVVVFLLLGVMIRQSGKEKKPAAVVPPAEARASARTTRLEISTLKPGASIPDWTGSQGNFKLVEQNGRTVLELGHEPLVEGRMVWSRLLGKSGIVRARMWGERTRRVAPRFAVGVGKAANYWFRVVPLERQIQFVGKEEKVLATAAWEGDPGAPLWLELRFFATGSNSESRVEGRVWREGETRPSAAQLECTVPEEFGFGRAVVAGAPYALKPVYIDLLEIAADEGPDKGN